ncbi:hypothetical protein N9E84_03665 [Planktomarina temperata]|nr:hypothetical protein [Planktomarina temperata]
MFQYFRSLSLVLLFSVGICSVGNAASFDCNKATTETEITICNDPGLSKLDQVLSELYTLKASINLSGDDLSYSADYDGFPDFFMEDTKKTQISWINENQVNCYANTKCLYSIYTKRIDDFFVSELPQSKQTWRIREKKEVSGSDFTVIIWTVDDNPSSNEGCIGNDFTPVYSLLTVHAKNTGALIDHNASILPVKENSCLMEEIEISSTTKNSFQISIGSMMAAGGWGASSHQYNFDVISDAVMLSSYKSLYFERNVFFFEETTIDFINGHVKFDYSNETEQTVERIGQIFNPGEKLSVKKSIPNVTSPNFSEINEGGLWSIYNDLLPE